MSRSEEAFDLFKTIPDYLNVAAVRSDIGMYYLRQGNPSQALAAFEEGERLITERGLRGDQPEPHRARRMLAGYRGAQRRS